MDPYATPLLNSARVVTRYCLPQASSDLPHVEYQLDALLDTFSADWTIVKAYKYTESLRCVQYLAARELPEAQDPFYKRWLLNRTAELAAIRGDLPTLQWLMEIYLPIEPVNYVVEAAAAFGHLELLQWLYAHHAERVRFGECEICRPLERKHEHVVTWLWEHATPATEHLNEVLLSAAKGGNLNIVKWCCETLGLNEIDKWPLQKSINGGNWEIARWIIERFDISGVQLDMYFPAMYGELSFLKFLSSRDIIFPDDTIEVAAAYGRLDVVKWLYRSPNVEAMACAAQNEHEDIVQWLFDTGREVFASGEVSLEPVFLGAAEYDNLDVIQWLHTRYSGSCGTAVMDAAASHGYLDVVKWLHENRTEGCSKVAMDKAAGNGHFDVVKYLHEHRSEGCTVDAMDKAAGAGHLEVVKWLNEHRSEGCSIIAMNCAAQNGHLDVVQWLHANRTEGCTSKAMDGAAENGHLDIVKWLHENRSDGCTAAAMDNAARHGHLRVVKWLHKHRSEGCTMRAMNHASLHGRLNIVKWLHVNRNEGYCTADAIRNGHFDVVFFLRLHREENFHRCIPTNETLQVPLELQQWLLANCGEVLDRCRFESYKISFGQFMTRT